MYRKEISFPRQTYSQHLATSPLRNTAYDWRVVLVQKVTREKQTFRKPQLHYCLECINIIEDIIWRGTEW